MKVPDISSIDNSLKVSKFILPSKVWDIVKLQGLVNQSCLQVILATPLPTNPISIPFVGADLEVENSPLKLQHGLRMDWICVNLSLGSSARSRS